MQRQLATLASSAARASLQRAAARPPPPAFAAAARAGANAVCGGASASRRSKSSAGSGAGAAGSGGSPAFQISEERLREFLQAEVSFFASQEANSISVRQVLDAATPERAAVLSHKELPIRFAQRILQIEGLEGWQASPELVEVHSLYFRTFRDLRLVELDLSRLDPFTEVVQQLKGRMRTVIPNLATAMRGLQEHKGHDEAMIGQWLDSFLLSRIGTEMLTSQYMSCVEEKGNPRSGRHGIVDDRCDPAAICLQAARHAKKLCRQHFLLDQNVEIRVESSESGATGRRIRFPYVPQYLFYIMVELLKNSARATVEACGGDPNQLKARPITITVSADPSEVAIRVHDVAGGIPFSVADRVWSYMYSTAHKAGTEFSQQGTPLAGYGVGLPLSRLYARYLGGSLHLQSLPGVGTSAYLYLKRLESEAREELPTDFSGLSSVGSVSEPSYNF